MTLNDNQSQSDMETVQKINYYGLLSDHIIVLSIGATLFSHWAYTYYEPVLSFRLLDFTRSVHLQGLVFFSMTGGFTFMAIFVMYFAE